MTDRRSYNELSAEYDAEHAGKEYPLPPSPPFHVNGAGLETMDQIVMDDGRFAVVYWPHPVTGAKRYFFLDREHPLPFQQFTPNEEIGWTPRACFFLLREGIFLREGVYDD